MAKRSKKIETTIESVVPEPKLVRVKFLRHLTIDGTTYWRDKEYDLAIEVFEKIQNKSVIQVLK